MAANNWAACPKCRAKCESDKEAAIAAARAMYGKASEHDYRTAIRRAEEMPGVVTANEMREDWEIGINSRGEFVVHYEAKCARCGWFYKHDHAAVAFDKKASK